MIEEDWKWVRKFIALMMEGKIEPKALTPEAVTFLKSQEMYHRETQAKMGKKISELNQKLKESK